MTLELSSVAAMQGTTWLGRAVFTLEPIAHGRKGEDMRSVGAVVRQIVVPCIKRIASNLAEALRACSVAKV